MSPWNDDALASMRGELKLNVLLNTSGLIDKLERVAGGFMSRAEAQAVQGKSGNAEKMHSVIEILRGKSNDDFYSFCRMLRESSNTTWADELQRVAANFRREREGMYMCRLKVTVHRADHKQALQLVQL